MEQERFITEKHTKARNSFRVLGPIFVVGGLICMVIAAVDFFTLSMFEEPRFFWLFFLAIPILFIGFVLSGLGYGGKVAKYQAREYAPVAKDTFNYLAKETSSGVTEISQAVNRGRQTTTNQLSCPHCQKQNSADAKFCDGCGGKLAKVCASCGDVNKSDAHFCDECGARL